MRKIWMPTVLLLAGVALSSAEITRFKTAADSWDNAFAAALKSTQYLTLPPGEYKLTRTLEVPNGLTLVFENGAALVSSAAPVIRFTGGTLTLEGRGRPGRLEGTATGRRGWSTSRRAAVIDLNHTAAGKASAELVVRNMTIKGFNGIDGYWRRPEKGNVGAVDIAGCRFECAEKAIGILVPELRSCRIENSVFDGADGPIFLNCPIPDGVVIRGNILRNFGRCGMMIGKAGQIAEGCTRHVPNAIVHDNQLLGGGRGETIRDSYTQGILIYGHNVSVQGNIVRDVNRGEPLPDGSIGRQIRTPEGEILRGKTIKVNGKPRRLAGAAIYLKANRALVQGNICTNSGWRSVIEIKTGGKEHFVSVVGNVVDGRALAVDESFGFECNSGRSLWANNVVYDMPHQAFVVRSGFENTFLNNLIVNAKVGFALSGRTPGQNELIAGNRFINVKFPVALDGKKLREGTGRDVYLPPPARIGDHDELPAPGPAWYGRQLLRGDRMYLGVKKDSEYRWMELTGKIIPVKRYRIVGPELAFNADQSGRQKTGKKAWNNPLHPGWTLFMRSAGEKPINPNDGHISFDTKNFKTGGRSLKIAFRGVAGEWRLRQALSLRPGARYRATAVVRGEEPENLRLEVIGANGFSEQIRARDDRNWQTLSVDFTTPSHSGRCTLSVRGSKTTAEKAAWLDSVSVRELEEVSATGRAYKVSGPELAAPATMTEPGKLPAGWDASTPTANLVLKSGEDRTLSVARKDSTGNLLLSQNVKLEPGKRYRATAALKSVSLRRISFSVKTPDGRSFAGRSPDSAEWETSRIDFVAPEKRGNSVLRIWIGGLKPGEEFQVGRVSLRRLE